MTNTIMTVLGPMPADQLGVTLMHEHLLLDLSRGTGEPDHLLKDFPLAVEEVGYFREAGGATLVDVTSLGLERDPASIQKIAVESRINIVMGCGWYREPFYYHDLYEKTTNQIADEIVREIEVGAADTGIRAGIIGEIGAHLHYIQPSEERSFRAAARAHKRTGLTVTTHAVRADVGLAELDILEEEGVDLRRVIVGHCDTYYSPDYHEAIARRGAFVEFDTIRGKVDFDTVQRVRFVKLMLEKGYLDRVLLSHDICMKSHLHAYGGYGYDYVVNGFSEKLVEAGVSREQIHIMLVENPRAALTGERAV